MGRFVPPFMVSRNPRADSCDHRTELERVVATECPAQAHETIDDALRTWLYLAAKCRDEFSQSEDDVAECSQRLLEGGLFNVNQDLLKIP